MADANDDRVINEHFGAAVRLGMKRYKVKIQDVVSELGVSRETVRLWRKGETVARDKNLAKLAKMIGMEPADMRYEPGKKTAFPAIAGEHVTDEDELALIRAYRGIKKPWARRALRMRAVELLEEFGEPGPESPFGKTRGAGTQ
ncbi:MAG: helix-turn-helix domain-containing protein [Sinimarinibacterium sp.]